MKLRPAVEFARGLTQRAWKWLRSSLAMLRTAVELAASVRHPTPTTEALLVSEPAVSDEAWLAELQRQMATQLGTSLPPALPEPTAQALLAWRRQTCAQFEDGAWLPELAALAQPGTTLCASIRERGVVPRQHSLLIRAGGGS